MITVFILYFIETSNINHIQTAWQMLPLSHFPVVTNPQKHRRRSQLTEVDVKWQRFCRQFQVESMKQNASIGQITAWWRTIFRTNAGLDTDRVVVWGVLHLSSSIFGGCLTTTHQRGIPSNYIWVRYMWFKQHMNCHLFRAHPPHNIFVFVSILC